MATVTYAGEKIARDVFVVNDASGATSAGIGAPDDAAWSGTGDASMIALLKAIHAQNETIIGHLAAIETNTTPAE